MRITRRGSLHKIVFFQLTFFCHVSVGSLNADMVNGANKLEHLYVNSNKMGGNLDDFALADLRSLQKLRLE